MEQLTPAQQHFRQTMAARRGNEGNETVADMTAYEQILHRLRVDKSQLKQIQGTENKIDYKKSVLHNYEPWIDGVMTSQTGQADEVFSTVMVWQIDCGNYERALDMAEYALHFNLPVPDNYSRTLASILIDEICDPALALFKSGIADADYLSFDILQRLDALTKVNDMPDEVRAKLYKTMAYTLRLQHDVPAKQHALVLLQQAILLNSAIGVKRDIENLQRDLKGVESEKVTDDNTVNNVNADENHQPKPTKPTKPLSTKKPTVKKQTTPRKKVTS